MKRAIVAVLAFVTLALSLIIDVRAAHSAPPYGWREFPAYAVNVNAYGQRNIPRNVCPTSAVSDVDGRSRRTGSRVTRVTLQQGRRIVNASPIAVRVYVFCG